MSAVGSTVNVMTTCAEMSAGIRRALADRAEARRFLTGFAADWRAPLEPGDGNDSAELDAAELRLGLKLPAALREAYLLLGRRDDLLRNQDRLQTPDKLYIREGALIYHTENQGVAEWGILLADLSAEDPPTFHRLDLADKSAEHWEPWTDRLSAALVELVMSETALYDADDLSDATDLPAGGLPGFEPLPAVLPDPHEKSEWFLGEDALLHVNGGCWLTVRARTAEALDAVREAVPGSWINRSSRIEQRPTRSPSAA